MGRRNKRVADRCQCRDKEENLSVGLMRFDDNGNLIFLDQDTSEKATKECDDCTCSDNSRKASRQHKTQKRRARCRSGSFTAIK